MSDTQVGKQVIHRNSPKRRSHALISIGKLKRECGMYLYLTVTAVGLTATVCPTDELFALVLDLSRNASIKIIIYQTAVNTTIRAT